MAAEAIDTSHWISSEHVSSCMQPGCETEFSTTHTPNHCYRCGLVYCLSHVARKRTMRDRSTAFKAARTARARERVVETNKLLRRLEKLALGPQAAADSSLAVSRLSASPSRAGPSSSPGTSSGGGGSFFSRLKAKALGNREFEASVVRWKPEKAATQCGACEAPFSLLSRKIHCRLCGNVFCSSCTQNRVPFGILRATHKRIEVPDGEVRTCSSCFQLATARYRRARLEIKIEDASAVPSPLAYMRYYHAMAAERKLINNIVPEYESVTAALDKYVVPSASAEAQQARREFRERQEARAVHLQKMLTKHFHKLEALGKRVAALDTDSPLTAKVQRNIYLASVVFTQELFAQRKALAELSRKR
ncbi:uncharacterized protein AMSG_05878 [Thecamonas trahens ATCC 50062]|uniref:FYVE-type domain-containing protein n=1 Tax=Thecamonas trahens ATCC 50062 TaxID=461836 RepID=A0A0L0DDE2_THETB|nr:hypothetical protein AMSG_05878 [Thecamonas trahens ATCC 50062]KNC50106.1 hypothetical protein AMSG_05878 [Thecamonas trahens ATCC 50062]|eukprot:XP_013757265.1 hypothetical protein AMSG_05878 [Thecamonas trahens ATCC 50062]